MEVTIIPKSAVYRTSVASGLEVLSTIFEGKNTALRYQVGEMT